ncbi:PIN domain-like protein, partial [Mycena galopus ATCC 62051]
QILEPALQRRCFEELTVSEGFVANRNGIRALRVGIDASAWLSVHDIQRVNVFHQLCQLLRFSITVIFVFPGPHAPIIEQPDSTSTLANEFQSLIQAFGFHYYTAPGNARAELACLNRLELIDVIFTAEPDIFVLGATHVVYSPEEDDYLEAFIYTSEAIYNNAHLSLGGILLTTVLLGTQHHRVLMSRQGLPGCNENMAYALGRSGLGDTLLFAVQNLDSAELRAFLTVWRMTLCQVLLRQEAPYNLIAQVSETFPDPRILNSYVHPCTSYSLDIPRPNHLLWIPKAPDIVSMSRFCEDIFDYGDPTELVNRILDVLLPGLSLRRLSEVRDRS